MKSSIKRTNGIIMLHFGVMDIFHADIGFNAIYSQPTQDLTQSHWYKFAPALSL